MIGVLMAERPQAEGAAPRPLPRTQARMADRIVSGQVRYHPTSAVWYLNGDVAVKSEGRALREMRSAGLIEVDTSGVTDDRDAFPVVLTDVGKARHRPQ